MIFGILNQKGGADKTTVSINLAVSLMKDGHKILLIDKKTNKTLHISFQEHQCAIRNTSFREDISEIEKISSQSLSLNRELSDNKYYLANALFDFKNNPIVPILQFPCYRFTSVISKIKATIIDWALDLESKGIIGKGITFSEKEKRIVQEQHYHF